jgi:Zn-dependent protease/CBS domain-containing protein
MNRSIYIGTIFGIPIKVNYSWFIVFFLVTWTLAQDYFPSVLPSSPTLSYWLISIVASLLLFATLLAHELSHSVIAIKNGLPIRGITLFVFGGVAQMSREPQSPEVEFKMAAAGPLCSFGLSLIFYIFAIFLNRLHCPLIIVKLFDYLSFINLAVAIFNLIPGFPLDGGRILRAAIWSIMGDVKKATRVASTFGKMFAYFIMALGFFYLFYGVILSGIWLIFIGFFLQEAASTSYQQVALKNDLSGYKVRDIMAKDIISVSADISLLSLVDDYFFRFRFTSFPVTAGEDIVEGIVTIHSVKDIPKELWPETKVGQIMIPIDRSLVISADADAYEAMTMMAGNKSGRLMVISGGKLIGMISQRDILRLFEVKEDLS